MFAAAVHDWALRGAEILDAIAAVVVVLAALVAVAGAVLVVVKRESAADLAPVRRRMSERFVFGLELLIGSDIIRTAVSPSWQDLGQLAAIVVLRVAIDYTLLREIKRDEGP